PTPIASSSSPTTRRWSTTSRPRRSAPRSTSAARLTRSTRTWWTSASWPSPSTSTSRAIEAEGRPARQARHARQPAGCRRHRQRRRDHLRARHPGRDRGRGEALHRHRRPALALRALDLVRAAATGQSRLCEVVHGRRPRLRALRADSGVIAGRLLAGPRAVIPERSAPLDGRAWTWLTWPCEEG